MNIFSRWFAPKVDQDIDDSQNPWAGLASYEDPQKAIQEGRKPKLFCGRDEDSYDVAKLIMGNVFVTLYGKSGIGKTSLLNAGVFPELREEHYSPISLRLGMRDEEHPQSYQDIIIKAVEQLFSRIETIDSLPVQDNEQSPDFLWKYFANHHFFDKDDDSSLPVIVLDQFEEVFRTDRKEAEILLRQLDQCVANSQSRRYEINARFVVSIREDDLYRLEDSIDNCYLPALKRSRYRLRSLSEQGARDVILIPGKGLFLTEEQDIIADAIINKARNEDGSISTNIVSLLCSRIYVDSQKSSADHITPALVDNFIKDNPFERFYNEATKGFSNREKAFIESNLVDSTGRRNSVPESNFMLHVKHGAKLLEGKNRILQRSSTSSDGKNYRIELIHDSFCNPLAGLKKKRERNRRVMLYASTAGVVLLCVGIAALIFSQRDTISQREKELEAKNAQLEKKNVEISREKNSALKAIQELENAKSQLVSKNKEILDEKNAAIIAFNEKTKALADLRIANDNLQKNLIKSKALEISHHLADGRIIEMIDTLINLFPNKNRPEIPYVAEVEQVLRQAYDSLRFGNGSICRFVGKECFRYAVYSPDDKYIAAASNDSSVILWNAKTFEKKYVLRGHQDMVDCVNFSSDGNKIVSYAYDGSLIVWDIENGHKLMHYNVFDYQRKKGLFDEERNRQSGRCEFNHKGNRILATVSGIGCHIIDTETGQLKYVLPRGATGTTSLSSHFLPNDTDVLTNVTGNLLIWNPVKNDTVLLVHGKTEYDIDNPIISKDGNLIAYSTDDSIKILSANGSPQKSIYLGHSTYEMDFSNNSQFIATATYDTHGLINIIDVNKGEIIKSQTENKYLVLSAKFSHDDERLVTSCVDNSCRVFNTGFSPIRFVLDETKSSWKKNDSILYITCEKIYEGILFGYDRNIVVEDTIAAIYVGKDVIDDVLYNDSNNIIVLSHKNSCCAVENGMFVS